MPAQHVHDVACAGEGENRHAARHGDQFLSGQGVSLQARRLALNFSPSLQIRGTSSRGRPPLLPVHGCSLPGLASRLGGLRMECFFVGSSR